MINQDYRLDVTVYYKDIKNLISTRDIGLFGYSTPVTQFVNEDYGSAKGVDVTVERIAHGNFSGRLTYSYMLAKGNSSSAYEGYYNYITDDVDTVMPVQEYPLAFDQRHTLTLHLDYRAPRDWKGRLFGLTIPGAWGLNLSGNYGSGLPYTITDNVTGVRVGGINEARLPSKYTVDLRFNKDIYLGRSDDRFFSFFVEVDNLFNRRNVLDVYTNTGKPDDEGLRYDLTADPDGDGPYTAEDVNRLYRLLAMDPTHYSAPRRFRVGLSLNF